MMIKQMYIDIWKNKMFLKILKSQIFEKNMFENKKLDNIYSKHI